MVTMVGKFCSCVGSLFGLFMWHVFLWRIERLDGLCWVPQVDWNALNKTVRGGGLVHSLPPGWVVKARSEKATTLA